MNRLGEQLSYSGDPSVDPCSGNDLMFHAGHRRLFRVTEVTHITALMCAGGAQGGYILIYIYILFLSKSIFRSGCCGEWQLFLCFIHPKINLISSFTLNFQQEKHGFLQPLKTRSHQVTGSEPGAPLGPVPGDCQRY